MVVYAVVSIIMMAVFFRFVQQRWPKRRSFARSNSLNKASRQLSPAKACGGYQALYSARDKPSIKATQITMLPVGQLRASKP